MPPPGSPCRRSRPARSSCATKPPGTLTLDGVLSASAAGDAHRAGERVIDNAAGANALVTNSGRYILYSNDPAANTLDGLAGFAKHYAITYDSLAPASVGAGGDWSFYAITPTLDIIISNQAQVYGGALPAFTYNATGLIEALRWQPR